jgi:signal transduction histidine kinase
MIMNVLSVSRAEAGRLETYLEDVDLSAVARETLAAFELVASRDGRVLRIEADVPVPARTDQTLVRRMVANLVRNALRHTPPGTEVLVRADRTAGKARLSVIDTGPGIPPDVQPLLFERFGAPVLRERGLRVDSGLGLAFCKSAADALGVALRVQSDGRKGTTFVIEFQ